jgi:hypothetical protein
MFQKTVQHTVTMVYNQKRTTIKILPGVKIQVAKVKSDEVQVAVVGSCTFTQLLLVSLNTQLLLVFPAPLSANTQLLLVFPFPLSANTQLLLVFPPPLSANSQSLAEFPLPPLVEACVHVAADAAAPAQSMFVPPSLVVHVEAVKGRHVPDVGFDTAAQAKFAPALVQVAVPMHVPVFAAAHVPDVGNRTNSQLAFVPLALTLQSLGTVLESPNPCQVKLVSTHEFSVVKSGLEHFVQIPCVSHESLVV